jgi:hypothetical protein
MTPGDGLAAKHADRGIAQLLVFPEMPGDKDQLWTELGTPPLLTMAVIRKPQSSSPAGVPSAFAPARSLLRLLPSISPFARFQVRVRVNVFPVLKDGDFSSESPTLQAST